MYTIWNTKKKLQIKPFYEIVSFKQWLSVKILLWL